MARVLALGPPDITSEFARIVLPAHEVVQSADGWITVAEESDREAPTDFDAMFHLDIDRRSDALFEISGRRTTLMRSPVVFVNALTTTATEVARHVNLTTVVGVSILPGVSARAERLELAPSLQCDAAVAGRAETLLAELTGRAVERVEDRMGLVSARVLAMVINEAAFAVMERIATPEDIDTAMKLGTSYPNGPLAWCDTIGHEHIVRILDALYDEYHEERYRACVLLRQHARAAKRFTAA